MPTTTHPVLSEAGLADSTGYLDVSPTTLQHKKYDNIFGLGDVINAPTTKFRSIAALKGTWISRKITGTVRRCMYQ